MSSLPTVVKVTDLSTDAKKSRQKRNVKNNVREPREGKKKKVLHPTSIESGTDTDKEIEREVQGLRT